MSEKEWRTSSLIEAYWTVEQDESLRLSGGEAEQAAEARRRAYRMTSWSGGWDFVTPHPSSWWDSQ